MSKKSLWLESILFLAFISLFFILNIATPDKEFSELENRYLQQTPKFSFASLASGKFTADFETYTTDQFPFRDTWTTMKARSELAVGKTQNKSVYLCVDENTVIEQFVAPEQSVLDNNMVALNKLKENTDAEVYFALIPGKGQVWSSLLPEGAPYDSEKDVIDYSYNQTDVNSIDMLSALGKHSGEYIYYRTDHHWTSLGAYYGYCAIASAMGLDVSPIDQYTGRRTVSDSFYGTTYSSSGFSWIKPDSIEIFVEEPENIDVKTYITEDATSGALYDFNFLEKKDKYSMFLGGNAPLHEISTGNKGPSLLIVRDSYADSLVPFLLEDFSQIYVLDLRYYRASLSDYIAENEIDNVLVCYSVSTFCTDINLFLLGR